MTTRRISGSFALPGSGGTAGAVITVWAASRFISTPAADDPPPSGSPDYGALKTGKDFGAPGAWWADVDSLTDYWASTQYGGHTYWTFEQAPLGGGGVSIVDNGDGTLTFTVSGGVSIVDNGDGTLTFTV